MERKIMTKNDIAKIEKFFKNVNPNLKIEFEETWDSKERNRKIENISFLFGEEKITFYASTDSGCSECDFDGSNSDMIEVW